MKREKILANFLWRLAERCGAQGVSFVVSIVLARLLAPEAYGTIALVTVFTAILQVFVDSGFGNALIQKKNADDIDFSSVFYFNIVVCLILYGIMFAIAPLIANFYGDSELIPIIRVLCITIIISGVKNVQQAYVSRTLQFKRFFFSTIGGTIGSAVMGLIMAYMGCGVWALVAQQLANTIVDTIILWITVKWRPKAVFSMERLKGLASYGWKLLASSLLDTFYNNVRQLIIGKMYSSADLAYYNKGKQFPNIVISNVNSAIDSILLPVISASQDDLGKVKGMTRRAIKTNSYVIWPVVIGLAACAEIVIRLLLTDKWMTSVPYLQIFCITYGFWPIHTANLNAIKAMGRSDLFLKLEIIKKIVGMALLFSTMWFGVMAMAYSLLINSLLCQIINSWPNKKLLNYGYLEQLKDILPGILLAVVMGACVYPIKFLGLPDLLTLCIQIPLGAVIYILGSKLLKLDSFEYLVETVKPYIRKKRKH